MPTTRRRVNLTLTDMEERFLDAITTPGTGEHAAVIRYLGSRATGEAAVDRGPINVADVVHVLLSMGIDRLEHELGEISYATEAAAYSPDDLARIEALQRSYLGHVQRSG